MKLPPQQPHTRPITETLGAHQTLGQLLARVQASQARLATIQRVLPSSLRPHIRPGVLDATHWNLLVPNAAMAAKLRQCLPLAEQALRESGWPAVELRVKIRNT